MATPIADTIELADSDRLTPAARALLLKALNHMAANPDSINMEAWYIDTLAVTCGTVACLAGHICMANGMTTQQMHVANGATLLSEHSIPALARDFLGLDSYDAGRLFFPGRWPLEFLTPNYQFSLDAIVNRINHWLRTGE